jgi:PadR family transcriptional regulator PadR
VETSTIRRLDNSHLSYNVWEMTNASLLGHFEQLVLAAILSLGEDAYGVSIHAKAEELASPKRITLGATYTTLDRLEDKKLITSWLSDPTPERGGRAKRYYRLQNAGERALRESAITARRICATLEQSWGEIAWTPKWKPARP